VLDTTTTHSRRVHSCGFLGLLALHPPRHSPAARVQSVPRPTFHACPVLAWSRLTPLSTTLGEGSASNIPASSRRRRDYRLAALVLRPFTQLPIPSPREAHIGRGVWCNTVLRISSKVPNWSTLEACSELLALWTQARKKHTPTRSTHARAGHRSHKLSREIHVI